MAILVALILAVETAGPIVVSPPEVPADQAWAAEVVASALPRAIEAAGAKVVTRSDRLRGQERLGIPNVVLTRASRIRVAEALSGSRLVEGTCEIDATHVRLTLRLVDLARGASSAPTIVEGSPAAILDLIQSVGWDIALVGPRSASLTREAHRALAPKVPLDAIREWGMGLVESDREGRRTHLRRALTLAPGFDQVRFSLAELELEARDAAAAEQTLARVAPQGAIARPAAFLRGTALLSLGRYREASELYAGLRARLATAGVLNNLALARLRLGRGDETASSLLRQAVETEPTANDLHFNHGFALLAEGQNEAAAFWLRGVVRRSPEDLHARLALTWALRRAGHAGDADEEWKGLLARTTSYGALAAPDLTRRLERPRPSEGPAVVDLEGRSDAELAGTLLVRGEDQLTKGDLVAAQAALVQAVYLDPYSPRAHVLLARLHRTRGDLRQAAAELRLALWGRDEAAVRLELAHVLQEDGKADEARAEAAQVLAREPDNEAARGLLGR